MKRHDSPILERRSLAKGQTIIKEGEFGQQAYLIQSGEVKVYLTKDEQEVEIARLGAGEIFGEMALVFDGPRTANVKAVADTNLIVISRTQFQEKLDDSDVTIRAIVAMLSRRIVDANNTRVGTPSEVEDLKNATRTIYETIAANVSPNQLYTLKHTILPKLEELFEAIDAFNDRYSG